MKEEKIKIGEHIINLVSSNALPENCTLFLNPKNSEALKKHLKKIEDALEKTPQ